MMQADAILVERGACVLGRGRADRNRGSAAYAVIHRVVVNHGFQPEKRQQFSIEFARALEIRRGQEDMRNAVDLHRLPLRSDLR